MTDKPILFSAPMIRALLAGTKTQTRRVLKPQPDPSWQTPVVSRLGIVGWTDADGRAVDRKLPIAPGDRVWVRETWQAHSWATDCVTIRYRAEERTKGFTDQVEQIKYPDGQKEAFKYVAPKGPNFWRSPIHMPRWASRLTLIVTDVRVQRVQEITLGDCWAEGCSTGRDLLNAQSIPQGAILPFKEFRTLWNSIHGPNAWGQNPWVYALTFTVHRCNIDQINNA